MATLLQRIRNGSQPERARNLSLDEWAQFFSFNGSTYQYAPTTTMSGTREEWPDASFAGYVQQIYKANGIVYACMLVRLRLFSEARFAYRQLRGGRPGDLFGTPDLAPLENPWPGGTTGDLLARAIQDADLAGNFYAVRRPGGEIKRLRPDWMSIVCGTRTGGDSYELDAEKLGYVYHPGGQGSGADPVVLLPNEVCHFAPTPDPLASYRGMSWLTPVIREIMADGAATSHKLAFFEHAATPNLVVKLDVQDPDQFATWVELFERKYGEGQGRAFMEAYKTMFLGAGSDVTVVGADMKQLDFKVVQGHGETRVAAAAETPPVIVGLSEGLEAATYSNYGLAMRRFADLTMRPLWRNMAGSLATIVPVPSGSELWYDDRDIPALAENEKDRADIREVDARTAKALIDSGYKPDSVTAAIAANDISLLKHTGLVSVQLFEPTAQNPAANGAGTAAALRALADALDARAVIADSTSR